MVTLVCLVVAAWLSVGVVVGVFAIDRNGKPVPLLHFLAIVLVWPVVRALHPRQLRRKRHDLVRAAARLQVLTLPETA